MAEYEVYGIEQPKQQAAAATSDAEVLAGIVTLSAAVKAQAEAVQKAIKSIPKEK